MTIEPPTPTMEEGPKVKSFDGVFKFLLSDEESEAGDQKEGRCKEGGDEEGG